MRCAIYCRVSTDDQNLDRQVHELGEFVSRMQWGLVGEYSDKLSGAKRSRPGLDAMLEAAERREFDVLTVWALDRVGRSTLHTLEIVEKLDALGIHFRSYTQGAIDTTSPTGKLVLTILAGVAEMERSQIRERVRSGLSAAKKRGVKLGQRPLDDLVRERVLALSNSGLSVRKVAEKVSTRRYPVSKSSVQRILANGHYGKL
jgi:DNA invertase Pin-like site-specific DNA recombinase